MLEESLKDQENIINRYISAKDKNKPHLMKEAFTPSARLEMKVESKNISFPSSTIGLDAITDVLVSKFNQIIPYLKSEFSATSL